MGNTSVKPQHRSRYKKQVHWRAADHPSSPGKPQLVSGTDTTPDVVTIQWNPPQYDGGSPISGYLVEHRRYGSPHWVRATPALVKVNELSLSGLEPGWRYQFRVSAENSVGISDPGELSELLTVTFQKSASTAPRFIDELWDTIALENSKSEFTAKFVGQPSCNISWFKDGFEIFSSRRIRIITEFDKSVLTIHQTSLSDEGEIKCTATNRAGHASTKANLTIEAPPRIRLPKQYEDGLLFEIGEAIRLKVTIAGKPCPVVFWFHNNAPIHEDDRFSIESTDKHSYLRIEDAQRSDRGEYQIKAINKISESTSSFLVTVTDKPSPPGQARVVMTLGRSVTISWNLPVDDGGCKIGNYIVEYYRIGWDVWLKAATSRVLSTTIGDLIEGSEYKFRIKAESPYGVSEPSDESDTIFIPDPKRGILTPSGNQSYNKLEENNIKKIQAQFHDTEIPVRPVRSRIKSPSLTPKSSPITIRKEMNKNVDNRIFDRTSMDRDLAYGTPDIKITQDDLENTFEARENLKTTKIENKVVEKYVKNLPYFENSVSTSEITIPSNPALTKNISKVFDVKPTTSDISAFKSNPNSSENNSRESFVRSNDKIDRFVSKEKDYKNEIEIKKETEIKSPLNNRNDELANSSEFMLVLLPEDKNGSESHRVFDFDNNLIPPPISLSAPELGSELELFEPLRMAVSSTELLHARTMARFYEELTSEGYEPLQDMQNNDENKSNDKNEIKVPKILINSQDNQAIIGLERRNSYKRRASNGSITTQQPNWVDRRHSFKMSDLDEITQNKLYKFPITINSNNNNQLISDNFVNENISKSNNNSLSVRDKRDLYNKRQRSESEEKEEEEFEKVRLKMSSLTKNERKGLNITKLEDWDDVSDQEKLVYNENESDDESFHVRENDKIQRFYGKPADDENSPPNLKMYKRNHPVLTKDEPFEILTKPNRLPDPAFVPKPILKQQSHIKPIENVNKKLTNSNNHKHEKLLKNNSSETKINNNSLNKNLPLFSQKNISETIQNKSSDMKRESSPTVQPRTTYAFNFKEHDRTFNMPTQLPTNPNTKKSKIDEEIKVVVDHYGDIVQSYGQKNKIIPMVYLNTDDLKAAAENDSDEIDDLIENYSAPTSSENYEDLPVPTVKRKRSFTEVSSDFLKVVKDKVAAAFSNSDITDDTISPEEELLLLSNNQRRGSAQMKRRPSKNRQELSKSAKKSSNLKSNAHGENWSNLRTPSPNPQGRRSSPTPMRRNSLILPSSPQSRKGSGSSGSGFNFPKPKMRETTTQTIKYPDDYSPDPKKDVLFFASRQEALTAKAEVKVRTTIDYITDLAMFIVACWLYLFQNELLAIPVLLVMGYRQLKEEIKKWLPIWLTGKKKSKRK